MSLNEEKREEKRVERGEAKTSKRLFCLSAFSLFSFVFLLPVEPFAHAKTIEFLGGNASKKQQQ